ncbi:unnamed protein product [Owenia fusiformis]|uniref:Uncharacterized protein n=1 Tax=Owenia fusiformis TaxID=6347 RepID=A0A8J1TLH0_OWEFU|nr:unnamed protein product [Owenia fusiformis]
MHQIAVGLIFVIGFNSIICQLCPRPTSGIENGSLKPKCSTSGCSSIKVKCKNCYKRVGPGKINCKGGQWAPIKTKCDAVLCGKLKLPANTVASSNSTHCGAAINVRCAPGYGPSKATKMICKSSGKWKGKQLKCSKIKDTCDDLSTPKNAELIAGSLTGNKVGDSATFQCKKHYKALGKLKVSCVQGGKWSSKPSDCKLGGRCPDIFPGNDVGLKVTEGKLLHNIYEDRVFFACEPGLVLMGHSHIMCRWDGAWNQAVPTCIKTSSTNCPDLTVPEHGFVTKGQVKENTFGDTVTFACDPGYTLDGTPTLTCFKKYSIELPGNGTDGLVWDIAMPVCRLSNTGDCPDLVLPKYGFLVGDGRLTGNEVGDNIVTSCRKPYMKQGGRVLTCLANGKWDKPMIECIEIDITCPDVILEKDSNLVVLRGDLSGNKYYDRIIFGCSTGFAILDGMYYTVCNRTGGWTLPLPVCKEAGCKSAGKVIEHGTVRGVVESGKYDIGASLDYECDECYQLIGAPTRTCQLIGTWSPIHPPSCTVRTCTRIESLEHGAIFPTQGRVVQCGESFAVQCNKGYVIKGENKRTKEMRCTPSGWDPLDTPICLLNATCQNPPVALNNGEVITTITGRPHRIGDSVTFKCNDCYKLEGNDTMTCLESQLWSSGVPQCVAKTCEDVNSGWISVTPNNPSVNHDPSNILYKLVIYDECDFNITCMEPVFKECGLPFVTPTTSGRIFDGVEANSHSWPWAVVLFMKDWQFCGGSLIHPQWVLSAAHCFGTYRDPGYWRVVLGKHNISKKESGEITATVSAIFTHPAYSNEGRRLLNDYALLKLDKPVTLTQNIIPACVPPVDYFTEIIDGAISRNTAWLLQSSTEMNCTAIGWGLTRGGFTSDELIQVALPIIPNKVCNKVEYLDGSLHQSGFCAGGINKDTCSGDSGGAFMCKIGSRWMLAGLTSYGPKLGECGVKRKPGVYARIFPSVFKWITDTIK